MIIPKYVCFWLLLIYCLAGFYGDGLGFEHGSYLVGGAKIGKK